MRTMWLALFVASSCGLLYLLIRRKIPGGWFTRFGTHLVLSALAIYAINFSGLATGWYVPLNPGTIGTVAVLGLPGIGLILGVQQLVLS
ncbi:pro-sigmaK processing inhibitor BofA family protein [Cohnella xylanilytica]|uniref:Pro-sigmaK processing inhibitor BofA family protein n=1 Tax=Cohnella xylanilytica TaxID=557555 RepID=A0A841U8E6_9BACL|nr:pro-sigmaK processing inhibitor BofA family protein [Cohnella xylanilytica]MBB6695982.1 pro-sigmaK processing inhibitor BofA family protein [Cohnella xylanilytica]